MFVCSNRNIAFALYKIIIELRPAWAKKKICADGVELSEKNKKELKPIEMIKLVMTRNKDDEKELLTYSEQRMTAKSLTGNSRTSNKLQDCHSR
jgi:hypothetical protein